MRNIYVFGNEYLDFDSFAGAVAKKLDSEFRIVHCRSPDDLLEVDESEMLILDVVKGIDEPIIITDVAQLKTRNIVSLHDFDLGFFLNLMEELGEGKKVKIIGVPQEGDVDKIVKQVEEMLKEP